MIQEAEYESFLIWKNFRKQRSYCFGCSCGFGFLPLEWPSYSLYTDVASKEQQKPTLPLSEEKEEVDSEDAAMETEMQNNEDLKAVDIEELKPEVKKSGITKNSGKCPLSIPNYP